MAPFVESETKRATTSQERDGIRVLCLGNDLLADDAFGFEVARRLMHILPAEVEIVCSSESGFALAEHLIGCETLIIVDSIRTGAPHGTIHVIGREALQSGVVFSPHRTGIMNVLQAAETLGLSVPEHLLIYAVEAADVTTIGGQMNERVREAIEVVTDKIAQAFGTAPRRIDAQGGMCRGPSRTTEVAHANKSDAVL